MKNDLARLRIANIDCHPVFIVSRRTLRKYAAAIGGFGTSYLKPKNREDKIGKEFELVYGSPNTRWFVWWTPMIYIVMVFTSIICGRTIYHAYWLEEDLPTHSFDEFFSITFDSTNPLTAAYAFLGIQVAVLLTVLIFMRKNLLRLYYNRRTKDFVAVILRYGLYKQKVPFKQSDVKFLDKVSMNGNVTIKGNRLLVCEKNFISTPAYNVFMGYDISRPSEYKKQMENEDLEMAMRKLAKSSETYASDKFVKEYREKRKKRKER